MQQFLPWLIVGWGIGVAIALTNISHDLSKIIAQLEKINEALRGQDS